MKLILQAIKSMFRGIEASRTHYDERETLITEYIFDGNLEGKETVAPSESNGFCMVKVADEFPEMSTVKNLTITYSSIGGEWKDETEKVSLEEAVGEITKDILGINSFDVLYISNDIEFEGVHFPKGLYFSYYGGDDWYVSKLSVTHVIGELKTIDDKYLSDNIARVKEVRKALNDVQSVANEAQSTANSAITKINLKPSHLECGTTTLPVISSNSIAVGQTLSAEFDKGATNTYNSLSKLGNYGDTISIRIWVTQIVDGTGYNESERVIVLHRYDFNSAAPTFCGTFTVRFVKNYSNYLNAVTDHFETYYVEIHTQTSADKGYSRLLLTRIS